jgi:hypothetical protein
MRAQPYRQGSTFRQNGRKTLADRRACPFASRHQDLGKLGVLVGVARTPFHDQTVFGKTETFEHRHGEIGFLRRVAGNQVGIAANRIPSPASDLLKKRIKINRA